MHFPGSVKYLWVLFRTNYYVLILCSVKATAFAVCLATYFNANEPDTRLNCVCGTKKLGKLYFLQIVPNYVFYRYRGVSRIT